MGTSAASHGASPKQSACAIPNLGLHKSHKTKEKEVYKDIWGITNYDFWHLVRNYQFLAQSGLKCTVKQIFPPLYIWNYHTNILILTNQIFNKIRDQTKDAEVKKEESNFEITVHNL